MKITLFAIATLAMGNIALAVPTPPHPVMYPSEPMVVVPGLEFLGESRISSVTHCVTSTGANDWRNLITDMELQSMESCLRDLT